MKTSQAEHTDEQSYKHLVKENKALKLQNEVLEKMIRIAEETYKIEIKKNYSPKQ